MPIPNVKKVRVVQVDAFASEPFSGNPAAVCLLPSPRDPEWMLAVAREMNLAETAFLVRRSGADYDLRWFSPAVEIDLCGHATLASAHVLWEDAQVPPAETARFHTRSGVLTARQRSGLIELDFPTTPDQPVAAPDGLAEALGTAPRYMGRSRFDYLVELASEADVRALQPDFVRLRALPVRGVIVTSRASTAGWDFVSRFFAPGAGIDEDPVTGSAHCCLAPFWSQRLGKNTFTARQISPRGGTLHVTLAGDRVLLGGQAVTVLRGELIA
jgi:PhzF family phenazine biosynthesis protein